MRHSEHVAHLSAFGMQLRPITSLVPPHIEISGHSAANATPDLRLNSASVSLADRATTVPAIGDAPGVTYELHQESHAIEQYAERRRSAEQILTAW